MNVFIQTILDPILLRCYTLTGVSFIDALLGTLVIGVVVVLIGDMSAGLVLKINHKHLNDLDARLSIAKYLSAQALEADDQRSYRAVNKEANELFGQLFFSKFGISAATLWPAFFALQWMQCHVADQCLYVPATRFQINYVLLFFVCYLIAGFLVRAIKKLIRKRKLFD
jgi:hypothetical protein